MINPGYRSDFSHGYSHKMNYIPKVSVIMPVYNGDKYLREAVDSILSQTFTDFEFIIINDGSTDRTREILESYYDQRIRLVHQKNIGISASLNKGINLARGEYIARMDADDISLPDRFLKQVSFLDLNPDITVCGTWLSFFNTSKTFQTWKTSTNYNEVKCNLLFGCDVAHPSVFIRKADIIKNKLFYKENFVCAQDYELWVRISAKLKITNIGEVLLKYRIHNNQIGYTSNSMQETVTNNIIRIQLENLGITFQDKEIELLKNIGRNNLEYSMKSFIAAKALLSRLIDQNTKTEIYPVIIFNKFIFNKFWNISNYFAGLGFKIWKTVFSSELYQYNTLSLMHKLFFFLKCLLKYGDYNATLINKNNIHNKYLSFFLWLLSNNKRL